MPYYISKDGKSLMDSSHEIEEKDHLRINELEYAVARLIVIGYSPRDIERAVRDMEAILNKATGK